MSAGTWRRLPHTECEGYFGCEGYYERRKYQRKRSRLGNRNGQHQRLPAAGIADERRIEVTDIEIWKFKLQSHIADGTCRQDFKGVAHLWLKTINE